MGDRYQADGCDVLAARCAVRNVLRTCETPEAAAKLAAEWNDRERESLAEEFYNRGSRSSALWDILMTERGQP